MAHGLNPLRALCYAARSRGAALPDPESPESLFQMQLAIDERNREAFMDFEHMIMHRFPKLKKYLQEMNIGALMRRYSIKFLKDSTVMMHLFHHLLLTISTNRNMGVPVSALTSMYLVILYKYCEGKGEKFVEKHRSTFAQFYKLIFELKDIYPQECAEMFTSFKEALNVDSGSFLSLFHYTDNLGLCLLHLTKERCPIYDAKCGSWLMDCLSSTIDRYPKVQCEIYLIFGFRYCFEHSYYRMCCQNLGKLKYQDQKLDHFMSPEIADKGNLRRQLAVSFLVYKAGGPWYRRNFMVMLYKAYPYPFLSAEEYFSLLRPFFQRNDVLQYLINEYVKSNGIVEVPAVPQPRSLMHLARVQVRENMNRANSLCYEVIKKMNIPKSIVEYLSLGC